MITIKEELEELDNDELILILDHYGSIFTCCEDEHDVADHIIAQDVSHYHIASLVYIIPLTPLLKFRILVW